MALEIKQPRSGKEAAVANKGLAGVSLDLARFEKTSRANAQTN